LQRHAAKYDGRKATSSSHLAVAAGSKAANSYKVAFYRREDKDSSCREVKVNFQNGYKADTGDSFSNYIVPGEGNDVLSILK
jgi:hypothetical protein